MDNTQTQLDPSIVALTKAIGHQESGGDYNKVGDNGHSVGAYQWNNSTPLKPGQIPENFKTFASEVGADPNDFSPANQDKVAYSTVKKWGQQGLNPAQIASKWNSGDPDAYKTSKPGYNAQQGVNYDVGGYVNNVAKYYQEYQGQKGQSSSQPQTNSSGYITSASIPQQNTDDNSDLQAGNSVPIVGKLGQGLGYALSNAMGTQKGIMKDQDQGQQIESEILQKIQQAKSQGQDTSHLEDILKYESKNLQDIGSKVGLVGTGGIKNGQVIKSALGTAGLATIAPGLISGGIGLLKGIDALASPAVETAMGKFNIPMEEFGTMSNAEKVNALTESLKTAPTTDKIVIQQGIDKLLPQAISETGGKVPFSELYPKSAKVLGLLGKGAKTLGTGILAGAGFNEGSKAVSGLLK